MSAKRSHVSTGLRGRTLLALSVALVLGGMGSATAADGASYQAYALQHKRAAEIEPQLRALLGHLDPPPQIVADTRGNQLLLSGPPAAHQITQQFLKSVDQAAPARLAEPAVVQGYRVPPGRLAELSRQIEARFGQGPDVRLTADAASSQILVLAPPQVQALIARELAPPPAVAAEGRPPRTLPAPARQTEQTLTLTHVSAGQLESQLRAVLGERLRPTNAAQPGERSYVFSPGVPNVTVTLDLRRSVLHVRGDERLVGQLTRLATALDVAPGTAADAGVTTRVLTTPKADPARVREAVDAYRRGQQSVLPASRRGPTPNQESRNARPLRLPFRLVQHTEPADNAAAPKPTAPAGQPIPVDEQGVRDAQRREERLRALGQDVEIETLPDLDVIILRGRDRDVDEVRKIIAEIERLSAETTPVVDIYPLRHAHCTALATILELVAKDTIGGRQGKIHVTPLIKPNAFLLVGWGEAVQAMRELIAKLDQPVAPEAQLRVYRLTRAPVARALTVVQDAFKAQQGMAARVEVVADPRTNALIVRAAPRDLDEVDLLISRLDQGAVGIVNQARLFKLKNTLAIDMAATLQNAITAATGARGAEKGTVLELLTADVAGQRLLRSGLLSDVQLTPDPHTNTLVIIAPAESMGLLGALIEQLDTPTGVAQIKVFRIVNGDANSLATMLRSLMPAPATAAGAQLATAAGETALVPVRFSIDQRTNSIIATGSQGDLAIIEALLLRLDEEDVQQRVNSVYRLKNAPATDVARAINEFLRSERQVQQAAPGVVNPFEQIEREVIVVPEPVSNTLIISATPRFSKEITALVEKLDEQPAQVMIQVVIAEVELDDLHEAGVELGLQDTVLFDRSLMSNIVSSSAGNMLSANLDPGYNFNKSGLLGNNGAAAAGRHMIGGQGLSNFSVGRTSSQAGYGGLVLSASSDSVSLLLRALQQSQRTEVLGRPQIMTLDNQSAFIQVGERVPRVSQTMIIGQNQQNQVTLENTGLILGVTPRISPDGRVVMEIDAEKSKVGSADDGIPVSVIAGETIRSPKIAITTAQTTVSANSGETIVLGGLITKDTAVTRRGIPVLSDLPLLGRLFRYDSESQSRSELLIFLTPHVVRTTEEHERIKRAEAARMHWCLSDVHEIHGPTGLLETDSRRWGEAGEVIYPDRQPDGSAAAPAPLLDPSGPQPHLAPRP